MGRTQVPVTASLIMGSDPAADLALPQSFGLASRVIIERGMLRVEPGEPLIVGGVPQQFVEVSRVPVQEGPVLRVGDLRVMASSLSFALPSVAVPDK